MVILRRSRQRLIDQTRYARWVQASHALDNILPALVPVIQGIGKVDAELSAEDADYVARRAIAVGSEAAFARFKFDEGDALTDRLNLSSLWLFGAYEAVRTLDESIAGAVSGQVARRMKAVKREIERPRILLAKHQPARHHRETDQTPARPRMKGGSIAWRVAPHKIISRRNLADALLDLLERIYRSVQLKHG